MSRIDELRLMAKVARLYHGLGLRQTEIVDRLNLSQSTISRLLKRAEREGIVRITVAVPSGAYPEIEEALQERFGLKDAIVVDGDEDDERVARDLGAAAAFYLETTVQPREMIGISSWSAALLAMVDAMSPRAAGATVVQILGGIGNPAAEVHATQLTRRLANLVGGEARLLPAPGVVGSAEAKRVLMKDRYVAEAVEAMRAVSLALVGIGGLEPSRLLASSGNVFSPEELHTLSKLGAVGDICLHFFDALGRPVRTPLNDRVIGMDLQDLKRPARVVGIAGGKRKVTAILGALRGNWINVLITDRSTADALLAGESVREAPAAAPAGRRR